MATTTDTPTVHLSWIVTDDTRTAITPTYELTVARTADTSGLHAWALSNLDGFVIEGDHEDSEWEATYEAIRAFNRQVPNTYAVRTHAVDGGRYPGGPHLDDVTLAEADRVAIEFTERSGHRYAICEIYDAQGLCFTTVAQGVFATP